VEILEGWLEWWDVFYFCPIFQVLPRSRVGEELRRVGSNFVCERSILTAARMDITWAKHHTKSLE